MSSSEEYDPWYYAVANGHTLGIFTDLDDALESTLNYSYSNWKKFSDFDDAEEFLRENGVIVSRGGVTHFGETTWPAYDVMESNVNAFVAFCDGSALRNGRRDATAAYAALFPHNTEWNEVRVMTDNHVTSNRAEYSAALAVMERAAEEDPYGNRPVIIFTDSELLINTMYTYIHKWQSNGWITSAGGPVQNRDLIEAILDTADGRTMMYRHVKAHTGRQEWEYEWNDKADRSARNAARNWDQRYRY